MNRFISWMSAALLAAAVLAGCGGSGKVYQPLRPTAIYTFGDGIVDAGQTGKHYTVNPAPPANPGDPVGVVYSVPEYIANGYGLTLKPQSAGGTAYGQGGSKIADLRTQINAQTAAYGGKELIVLSAGMEDLIAQTQAVLAGTQNQATAEANIRAAVANYGQAMLQLHAQGARYIYILPPYDLSQSPWMAAQKAAYPAGDAGGVYLALHMAFRSALDAEAEAVNGKTQSLFRSPNFATRMGYYTDPSNNQNNAGTSITNAALCAAPGDVDASLCTTATLITTDSAQIGKYLYADNRHPVPGVLNLLANGSLSELKSRWGEP